MYKRGTPVGPFRLDRLLSDTGGMSSVYEATVLDQQIAERNGKKVAIKIARIGMENDHIFETLLRQETELLNDLRHPGVVRIIPIEQFNQRYYVGRAPGLPGAPWYFAMELLSTETVKNVIKNLRKYSLGYRLELIYQITIILDYLHLREVAHRDLKPDNIIFRMPPHPKQMPMPVLIDFGLGLKRRIEPTVNAATVAYASPERVRTLMRPNGYQPTEQAFDYFPSDVWALGVIAYELLTGKHPFGDEANRTALAEMIMNGHPAKMNGNIPPEIEKVVWYMLNKNPQHRPTIPQVLKLLETKIEIPPPRV
ncbi:MAG: hypothetical protein CUN56_08180 [Phototrophicales bacterium]|nr:MAG: hypothetical protein CUN56_08180 [Phototrophicales bacterium]RMG70066.1 MAG: serine/threonine protein kinase [Chloroflexota bacterium]